MKNSRAVLVVLLIGGLIAGGCQSNSTATIAEYRPKHPVVEHKAPDSEVIQLLRWTPVVPAATTTLIGSTKRRPARQIPVEVEEVYVQLGHAVGFRRQDGQLIAIADADTQELPEAHYEWKTLPGHPGSQAEESHPRFDRIVGTAVIVVAAVGIVALALWLIHADRHSLLDDLFNNGN